MSADRFLDTNILVHVLDGTDERKSRAAASLVESSIGQGDGCISWQVVQESLNVLTRKLGATPDEAKRFLDTVLQPLWLVYPSTALYGRGLDLQSRYRFGLYDSLIVASALEAGCTTLFSEDLQDGQVIGGLTIRNPFVA